MESKKKTYIGIDPDVDKNGVAIKINKEFLLYNFELFYLYEFLKKSKENLKIVGYEIVVYVECGFLNKGNRHTQADKSIEFNGKISERVGANHEIAKKICEMCEFLELEYKQIRPTQTKTNSTFFQQLTGFTKRTNQEQRDALMLIWGL
jgi:hypothetical protein